VIDKAKYPVCSSIVTAEFPQPNPWAAEESNPGTIRVVLYSHNPVLTLLHLPEDAIGLYGEDGLAEEGVEIPTELAQDVVRTYKHLGDLSERLKRYRK
jgi:hypothetical protein